MRKILPYKVEQARIRTGRFASSQMDGPNGAFLFNGPCGLDLRVIASDGLGWEHVSVSTERRNPNWQEMCWIKDLFWDEDETVIQYHPAKSDYVNNHPFCLHLWKPCNGEQIPVPDPLLVGDKKAGVLL